MGIVAQSISGRQPMGNNDVKISFINISILTWSNGFAR
jgi:hypothetical protein